MQPPPNLTQLPTPFCPPLLLSVYLAITHEVAEKNPSPPVSRFQTLPVSEPGLLTSAILAEILYMPFTVGEQFSLRNAQLYEIKPHFHY